jgi:putative copper export protein
MGPEFGVESPAFVAIRAVLSLCTIGLIGTMALRWTVLPRYAGPDAERLRSAITDRLPSVIDGLGIIAVAATLARLLAQHAAVFGVAEPWSGETFGTLLFRAGWGRSWWLAVTAAMALTWLAPRLRRGSRIAWIAIAIALLAFAVSAPLSGHPAAAERPWLAVLTQLMHIAGAGGWIGSLAALTLIAIPTARWLSDGDAESVDARIAGLVRAFSPTALGFSALLGLSGLVLARENFGGISELWQSGYGRTLMLKLGTLAIVAATGAYNWRRVLPVLGQATASARLRRSSLLELLAAFVVLVITASLVATPMPGE